MRILELSDAEMCIVGAFGRREGREGTKHLDLEIMNTGFELGVFVVFGLKLQPILGQLGKTTLDAFTVFGLPCHG